MDPEKPGISKIVLKISIILSSMILICFSSFMGHRKTESTFLLIKYSILTILIEWTNLFRIRSLNDKFSKYHKQSLDVSCKKNAPKSFVIFIEKYPCCSLNKGIKASNFIEKRLRHMYFSKNFEKVLRTPIF